MKKAKFSRLFSLLALMLVAAMLLTMVGCGEEEAPTNAEGANKVTVAPTDGDGDTDGTTAADGATTTTKDGETTTTKKGDSTAAGTTTTKKQGGNNTATTTKKQGGNNRVTTTTAKKVTDGDVLKQVPDSLSGTKISMQIWWNKATEDQKKADAFKKETGIEIKFESTSLDKYQTNLSAKVMSGMPPATAAIINQWHPQPITRGLMQPISNVSGWDFTDKKLYSISMMDQFGYKGTHYGLALKGSVMTTFYVMFYNKTILQKQGADDPYKLWKSGKWNWDTCLTVAKKCTDSKKNLIGMTIVGQHYWMLSAGTDFTKSTKAGIKNNLKDSAVLNAWNYNWDLTKTHKVIDTSYTAQVPFYEGKAAMFGAGSYFMQKESQAGDYVCQNMKDNWGVVPFPSPKGKSVASCEGIVWGFPTKVTGNKLQAAAWWLRYFLDDATYTSRSYYPNENCWEVMDWMWDQEVQSYNSVGVLTYGGEYDSWTVARDLVNDADTKAKVKSNLDQWYGVIDANINKIVSELG